MELPWQMLQEGLSKASTDCPTVSLQGIVLLAQHPRGASKWTYLPEAMAEERTWGMEPGRPGLESHLCYWLCDPESPALSEPLSSLSIKIPSYVRLRRVILDYDRIGT